MREPPQPEAGFAGREARLRRPCGRQKEGGRGGTMGSPTLCVAVANATRMAARGVEHRLVERLGERLPSARAESAG